jgi:hypothetical protein
MMARVESVRDMFGWKAEPVGSPILILLLATVAFLIAGAGLFTWREYHHNEEMQK